MNDYDRMWSQLHCESLIDLLLITKDDHLLVDAVEDQTDWQSFKLNEDIQTILKLTYLQCESLRFVL